MTQRNVERLIGRLVTDEALRGRFIQDPGGAVAEVVAEGWELTEMERAALASLDRRSLAQLAARVDRRIQKAALIEMTQNETTPHPAETPRPQGDGPRETEKEKHS